MEAHLLAARHQGMCVCREGGGIGGGGGMGGGAVKLSERQKRADTWTKPKKGWSAGCQT